MITFVRPSIQREVRKRGICLLLHSTHLQKNLPLILSDGRIHTAQELVSRYGKAHAARLLHDPHRYEQFAVGLNYVNASLTVPNVQLLYHRSRSEWQTEWIHLELDLSLLSLAVTRFCPVSAAADRGRHVVSGAEGFRSLFADSVDGCARHDLPRSEPTHPQAEILIHGSVDISLVKGIHVPHRTSLEEVSRLCERNARSIPVHISPHLFVWPERFR